MKILKKKKKIFFFFFFFFEIGNFFSNWEKSHLNPIGKGAEFRPLRKPKKIPDTQVRLYDFTPHIDMGEILKNILSACFSLKCKKRKGENLKSF